jgi:hypothetical protein
MLNLNRFGMKDGQDEENIGGNILFKSAIDFEVNWTNYKYSWKLFTEGDKQGDMAEKFSPPAGLGVDGMWIVRPESRASWKMFLTPETVTDGVEEKSKGPGIELHMNLARVTRPGEVPDPKTLIPVRVTLLTTELKVFVLLQDKISGDRQEKLLARGIFRQYWKPSKNPQIASIMGFPVDKTNAALCAYLDPAKFTVENIERNTKMRLESGEEPEWLTFLYENVPTPSVTGPRKNYEWVDKINLGFFGGACTCSDGSIHYVGEYRDSETGSCRHLACVNGISGECLRSAGKWSYGMTVCDSTDIEMSGNCLCKYGTQLPQGVLKCQDSVTCITAEGIPACHDETSKATGGPLNCNVGIPVKIVNSEGTPYATAGSFEKQLYIGTLLGIGGQYLGFLTGKKESKTFYSTAKKQSYAIDIVKGAYQNWTA